VRGGCLCGAVTWATDVAARSVLECHCQRCQRLSGNYVAATSFPTDDLAIVDAAIHDANLRWYSPADDPNVAYGFCATCGSTLFYRSGIADGTNDQTSVCVGSIDGPSGLRTSAAWFAADAGDHVRFDSTVTTFAGEPPSDAPGDPE
jgi:hypothetical protein